LLLCLLPEDLILLNVRSALTLRRALIAAALLAAAPQPAAAIVGEAELAADGVAQHLVLVRTHGGLCTGAVIGQDLVLTAAHCLRGAKMQVRPFGERKFVAVTGSDRHPRYIGGREAQPDSVDLALLKLEHPLPARALPAQLARRPTSVGEAVLVAGYGLQDPDATTRGGRPRMATLITLDRRFGVNLVLRDPTMAGNPQLGACSGDSGGPAFAVRDSLVVIGVVAAAPERCGGVTFVTPTAPYNDWIVEAARKLGSAIGR
jgi:S1-C subfamily serine protease